MLKFKTRNFRKELIPIGVSLILSSLIFYSFFVYQKEEILSDSNLERFHALNKLLDISNDLEKEIQGAIVYTEFFSIIISHDPNIDSNLLEKYSSLALKHNKNIKSVQFAPDAIIKIVYPRTGNEAAIGHDLLSDPDRKKFAEIAIEKRTVVMQGPVLALQGGFLLFNRKAIFIDKGDTEEFWGLAVVAIDFDKIIGKYKSSLNDVNYLFALRANNSDVQENLFGTIDIFEKKSIVTSINLPGTTWELAIYPKEGWKDEQGVFNYLNKIIYFIFVVIFLLAYMSVKNYLEKISRLRKEPLTNTLNKNAIQRIVDKKIVDNKDHFVLLVMDVNGFKSINDNLGHYVGDCVLIEVASRLDYVLRDGDALSRFGGDEYMVILDGLKNDIAFERIMQRMLDAVAKPMIIEGNSLQVAISIGYAVFPDEAKSYNELYQIADKKMYEYKKENKVKSTFEKYNEIRLKT